jgi:hypothetical protein
MKILLVGTNIFMMTIIILLVIKMYYVISNLEAFI